MVTAKYQHEKYRNSAIICYFKNYRFVMIQRKKDINSLTFLIALNVFVCYKRNNIEQIDVVYVNTNIL